MSVDAAVAAEILVTGRVQGVGFRPWAWHLARELGLAGTVANTGSAVLLVLEGSAGAIDGFCQRLVREAPGDCRVERRRPLPPAAHRGFRILPGRADGDHGFLPLRDTAPCADCRAELLLSGDRRYRYPFIACSTCGPRLTVAERLPWAREHTTHAPFKPCPLCVAEYADPADRRFHAELIACPDCGPQLLWRDGGSCEPPGAATSSVDVSGELALAKAIAVLRGGGIVALKGGGGYQLLCDARSEAAVATLRARKLRPRKPLAVLVADPAAVERLATPDADERTALTSAAAPIVPVRARPGNGLAAAVHPGLPWIGLMLPGSPLHLLLALDFGAPLVCTSGNVSGEPLWWQDGQALASLGGIADGVLWHDRPIAMPCDDSVVRVIAGEAVPLRIGRGLAPVIVPTGRDAPPLVGLGGHMKSAPALAARGEALLGPHVGDLDSPAARDRHAEVTRRLLALYRVRPHGVVHDAHPDYATTLAATDCGCYRLEVQHHHAHALASLAGDAAPGPVLAVTWDGTGLGEHGQLWGGEWLEVEAAVARRVAWLRPLPLPGGEAAIREPWRIAIALLREAGLEPDALTMPGVSDAEARRIARLCDAAGLVSRTSSAGRWLDGLSAVAGLCSEASFDGEAAMRLEGSLPPGWAVSPPVCTKPLQVERTATGLELDWRPFLVHVVTQLRQGADAATVASLAHAALVEAIVAVARARRARTVVLTGGCFQNRSLVEAAALRLAQAGIDVITPGRVPPNDGGLALGQVLAAVRRLATAPMDAA